MKTSFILSITLLFSLTYEIARAQESYEITFDLRKVQNDKISVNITLPKVKERTIQYIMPKIVPGTYSISDFGRFVSNFQAFDKKNKPLAVEKINDNIWEIKRAKRLRRIRYDVDDTFDSEKDNFIFEPAGTNIEEGENFIINTFGFVGYLEGYIAYPYRLHIEHQPTHYGSTSLIRESQTETQDVFYAPHYHEFADSPIMYSVPDTVSFEVGRAKILISVYSPISIQSNREEGLTAGQVKEAIEPLMQVQKDYMGGTLPVDRYAYIIYLFQGASRSGAYGALEHSYSSLYFLPDIPNAEVILPAIRDVSAHEFFHIITPLNVHSEEIGEFDYVNPKMSKHLWMYEGVTEYFAGHAQVYGKIISPEAYLETLHIKIETMRRQYNDTLAFTELSTKCLDEHKDEYGNVYEKGAIIGMCLDILLQSAGDQTLMQLMQALSTRYGKNRSFKDEELFDVINEMTSVDLEDFFTRYVQGNNPLPLEEIFSYVGISREAEKKIDVLALGNAVIEEDTYLRPVSTSLPMKEGLEEATGWGISVVDDDEDATFRPREELLTKIGDYTLGDYSIEEFKTLISEKIGEKVKVHSLRYNRDKQYFTKEEKVVKLERRSIIQTPRLRLLEEDSLSEAQNQLRRKWLNLSP